MAIKFRCYRCSQLLGVSASKIGAVVSCPRCSADLVVPDPDEPEAPPAEVEPEATDGPSLTSPTASMFVPPEPRRGALDTGVSLDFLDIRPEDIRVEPGVRPTRPASREPRPATVVQPAPLPEVAVPERTVTLPYPDLAVPPVPPRPAPTTVVMPPDPVVPPPHEPRLPPIQIDAPALATARRGPAVARPRDLTLPRSVVASWSLFVLLALLFAFFAGLLAGHYVWKVH